MIKEKRVPVSHTLKESLRKELKLFSKFSYRSESEVIEEAVAQYLNSKQAFQELRKAEAEKQRFFEELDDESNYGNMALLKGMNKGR